MIFNHTEKNIRQELKDAEVVALRQYCEAQGFTEDETVTFVKNSIRMMFNNETE